MNESGILRSTGTISNSFAETVKIANKRARYRGVRQRVFFTKCYHPQGQWRAEDVDYRAVLGRRDVLQPRAEGTYIPPLLREQLKILSKISDLRSSSGQG